MKRYENLGVKKSCWISSLASIGNDSLSHLPLGWRPFRLIQDRPERLAQIKKRWTPRSTVFPRNMTLSLWLMTSVLISLILISNYIFHSPTFVGRNPAPVDMANISSFWVLYIAGDAGLLQQWDFFSPPQQLTCWWIPLLLQCSATKRIESFHCPWSNPKKNGKATVMYLR